MIFTFWKRVLCFAFLPLYFGGGGGSSSAATTSTNTQETTDGGSTAIHAGGNVSITETSAANFTTLIDAFKSMSKAGADSLSANVSLAKDLSATTASAYKDAAAQASGNKNMVYAGMAVLAVVGLAFMRKG